MTNKERAELIQNAIRDYRAARESGDAQKIRFAVNYMENTFFAVSLWAVPGTEELRQMILSAKEDKARRIRQLQARSNQNGGNLRQAAGTSL